MSLQRQIQDSLEEALSAMGISGVVPTVSLSTTPEHGEFSTNVAMVAAKKLGKNPMEVGQEIVKELRMKNQELRIKVEKAPSPLRGSCLPADREGWGEGEIPTKDNASLIDKVEVAKPGFINFFIKKEVLAEIVVDTITNTKKVLKTENPKKYLIEYSSPNIAKPFTIGHLRSTIIGDAIANLLEATGNTVYRDNHVGDWGTQFGKQIYAIKTWGNEEKIAASEHPVRELVALYVKFHEEAEKNPELEEEGRKWFRKLEERDKEAWRLWQKCIFWSWKDFARIYNLLRVPSAKGAKFENEGRGYPESYFAYEMSGVLAELEKKYLLLHGEEGSRIVEFPEGTKLPPLMILKRDGATLYATRDVATDKFRLGKYGEDVIILNEVGSEQSLYFQQLYKLEEMLGWVKPGQRRHIKHGLYRFKDQKMSTRKGNVIWLEEVLREAIERAKKLGKEGEEHVAEEVGIGALKWNDLKRSSEQDIIFDWDDILNMQGNSGPYVQYTYVRCRSILGKLKKEDDSSSTERSEWRSNQALNFPNAALEQEEAGLLRKLFFFPMIVNQAAEAFAPHMLTTYLFELSQEFNHFYQKVPVLNAEDEKKQVRLFLVNATAVIIKEGLQLLGIQAPEKM